MEDQLDRKVTIEIDKGAFCQFGEVYQDLEEKHISYEFSDFKTFTDIAFPTRMEYRRDLDSDNNPKTTVSTEI